MGKVNKEDSSSAQKFSPRQSTNGVNMAIFLNENIPWIRLNILPLILGGQ